MAHLPPEGVLLDVDGTLVDSNPAHALAWVEAFAHFGMATDFDRMLDLIGKGGDKVIPQVAGVEKDSPRGEEISEYRSRLFMTEHLPKLRPQRDARRLLERMKASGLRLVIATSASEHELRGLLRVLNVEDLIDEKTSASDAGRSKPDPDIIAAALARSDLRPGRALMLGDTPYDVQAARRAGVRTVAFRCGGWADDGLAGAAAIYDGPWELLARYDDSPFGAER